MIDNKMIIVEPVNINIFIHFLLKYLIAMSEPSINGSVPIAKINIANPPIYQLPVVEAIRYIAYNGPHGIKHVNKP
jgi:hypothetical protein